MSAYIPLPLNGTARRFLEELASKQPDVAAHVRARLTRFPLRGEYLTLATVGRVVTDVIEGRRTDIPRRRRAK